jgi:hypothetical protein
VYTGALKHAADVVQEAGDPVEALATLHGYQNFVATREQSLH